MSNDPIKLVRGAKLARAEAVDRHVAARVRERRTMLGLTLQRMADLIGVTYQQAFKYEYGLNRISAGRLYEVGQALGVQVGYFFEGLEDGGRMPPTPQQRFMLTLGRSFISIKHREHQEALCQLARALADPTGRAKALAAEDGSELPSSG